MPETNESDLKSALLSQEIIPTPELPGGATIEEFADKAAAVAQPFAEGVGRANLEAVLQKSGEGYKETFKKTLDEVKDIAGESPGDWKEKMEKALPPAAPLGKTYAGNLVIPDDCIPFIRYQRSRYKESKRPDPEEVKRLYAQHVLDDYEGMKAHLPPRDQVKTILEIGCGIGALNVHLQRHYPDARIELLDGDSVSNEGGAGYSDKPDVYNSRAITELMLRANGCKVDKWHPLFTKDELRADLIVSLASLGYHYGLNAYKIHGTVICDLRRGPEKTRGTVIYQGPKYDRCIFTL